MVALGDLKYGDIEAVVAFYREYSRTHGGKVPGEVFEMLYNIAGPHCDILLDEATQDGVK